MKKYFVFLFLLMVTSCNAQKHTPMIPEIDNRFEIFDNFKYESRINKSSRNFQEFQQDGSSIEMDKDTTYGWYGMTPKDSYYRVTKVYYPNGIIKSKGISANTGRFQAGTWYEFDEEGKLIKEIDYDKPFKFTFEDILKFCEKEKIEIKKGPISQNGWHNEISRIVENGQPIWKIEYLKKTNLVEIIKLDGITGKIIDKETYDYINN